MTTTASATTANDPLGYAFAVAGAILFSTKGIFIKLAYGEGVSTEMLLSLRMIVALPVYLVILVTLLRREDNLRHLLTPPIVLASMAIGILGYYLSSYLDFLGLNFVSAQYERLVLFTYPFFVLLFGVWFFGDRMVWRVVPAMLVSYAGLLVIFGWNLAINPDGLVIGTLLRAGLGHHLRALPAPGQAADAGDRRGALHLHRHVDGGRLRHCAEPDPVRTGQLSDADAGNLGLRAGAGRARHGAAQLPDECRHGAHRGAGDVVDGRLRAGRHHRHRRHRPVGTLHHLPRRRHRHSSWWARYYLPELNNGLGKRSNDSLYWAFDRRKAAVMCGHDLRHTSGKGQPMNAFQKLLGGAVLALVLAAGLAAPASRKSSTTRTDPDRLPPRRTADIDFGDDTSEWANDGECDDPRFEGTGSAAETLDADIRKDATDCRAAYEAGTVTLVEGGDTPVATARDIDFGDDSSEWANDGECDDPRFSGTGSAAETLDADILKDATDCKAAYDAGTVTLVEGGDTPVATTADIDFGDDTSEWANDGECDDPRFAGTGSAAETLDADIRKDATDCRPPRRRHRDLQAATPRHHCRHRLRRRHQRMGQ